MRILVTGGDGLLAHQLKKMGSNGFVFFFPGHAEFDLTDPGLMAQRLGEWDPQIVINTAAYNLVDRCEIEREHSWAVNAAGPETLAQLCAPKKIKLIHFSTDYVFDGVKKTPYGEADPPNPLNHYAAGKLAGERAVLRISPHNLVLRTSWVFDWHPTQAKTFVHTIIKAARASRALKAATDQVSVPTFATDLAQWTLDLLRQDAGGLIHAVNDEGISRCDWTRVVLAEAVQAGLISTAPPVEPVLGAFFNSAMRRPDYTVMSNENLSRRLGHPLGSWHAGLRKMLAQMR